jgi:tRNA pseudouridine38-40 synthase
MSGQSSFTHRYVLRLAYHGAEFLGWQRQPTGRTVQGNLESTLSTWMRSPVEVVGAGRTDAGVHASNYVAHVDCTSTVDLDELVFRLNRFLPDDLVLFEAIPAPDEFHARFSAQGRGYRYSIQRTKSAFGRDTAWAYERPLNEQLLDEMAASLLGEHHFGAFERSGSAETNGMCTIRHARWVRDSDKWVFEIEGTRFLRNMVRALVGTMVEHAAIDRGLGHWDRLRKSQKRTESGPSAPAQGLTFAGAVYAAPLFDGRETPDFITKR